MAEPKNQRVFHPTLNQFYDVPAGDVESWFENGWRKTKPKHVDDGDAPVLEPADLPKP